MHIANATIALIVSPPPLCVAHAHVRHTNGCIRDTRSTARWKTTDGAGIAHALHTPSYPSSLLVLRVFVRTCTYVRARVCVTRSRKTLSGQFRLPPFFPFLTPWRVSLVRVCTPGNATKVLWRIEKEREREREIVASKSGKSIFIYGAVCSECLFIRSFIKDRLPLPSVISPSVDHSIILLLQNSTAISCKSRPLAREGRKLRLKIVPLQLTIQLSTIAGC